MSTYIVSDIHGASKKFYEMLRKININWSVDYLFINGDILDRGSDSLKLFREIVMMEQKYNGHLIIIKGNHEHFVEMYMSGALPKERYASYGGKDTVREIEELSESEKENLRRCIQKLPIYKIICSPNGEMVIVHSGLHVDHIVADSQGNVNVVKSIESALRWNENQFLISSYLQQEAPAWVCRGLDKCMCVGHVPTLYLEDVQKPIICSKGNGKVIMTDCGVYHKDGRLGCFRVEDGACFYV